MTVKECKLIAQAKKQPMSLEICPFHHYIEIFWYQVIGKSILFCRYLRNESSDLHKIWHSGQLLSCELKFKILRRFVHKCTRTSCQCACARFITRAHIYDSCTRSCARIFMKFLTYSFKIVIDYHVKFHEDLSFCGKDIRKTILTFQLLWISMCFPYFYSFVPQKSFKGDDYWMVMEMFGN